MSSTSDKDSKNNDSKKDESKCQWEIDGVEDEPTDFGNEFYITTGIVYGLAIALFIPCLMGKNMCFMLNPILLWIPVLVYTICNWIAYYHDPSRYIHKYKCLFTYMRCTHFSLLTGLFAFLFDMWNLYAVMGTTMSESPLRLLLVAPLAIAGAATIIYSFMNTPVIEEGDPDFKVPKQPDPIANSFDFIERDGRVYLYATIMFFGVVMALQGVFQEIYATTKPSILMRILGYIGILLGFAADAIALKFQIEYRAKDYCLPDEFK
jgi:hypothetical protein